MHREVEKTYKRVSQIEHILMRPDMYIGPVVENEQEMVVVDDEQLVSRTVKYVPALYKIFDEILVNAADNYQRDRRMTKIEVSISAKELTILNDGKCIPVQMHRVEKMYVPEMIFGHLLTSSNYEDEEKKVTGGRNGYGAKLANIFSTEFYIEIADATNKKILKMTWENNMINMGEPVIEPY
jgi:DNA topoisomerase-2